MLGFQQVRFFRSAVFFLAIVVVQLFAGTIYGQVIWSATGNSGGWSLGTNWTGGAVPTSTQVAEFDANPTGIKYVGFTGSVSAGAVYISSLHTSAFTLGDSISSANYTLTLNGATVNSINNVILADLSAKNFSVTPTVGSATSSTLTVTPGTTTTPTILTAAGSASALGPNLVIGAILSGSAPYTYLGGGTYDPTLNSGGVNGGTLELNAVNTFSGGITVGNTTSVTPTFYSDGVLQLDQVNAINNTSGNNITINPNSELLLNTTGTYSTGNITLTLNGLGNNANSGALRSASGATAPIWTGPIVLGSTAMVTVAGSGNLTLSGNISGSNQLQKQGGGTLTLSGTLNSWSGGTQIGNGAMIVSSGSSIGSGPLTMYQTSTNNTYITFNNVSQSISSLSSSFTATTGTQTQVITLGTGNTLTVNQSTNTTYGSGAVSTLTSTIVGAGSLVKQGSGTLTLTSLGNTFSGGLTVTGGSLIFAPATAGTVALTSTATTMNGGTLGTTGIIASGFISLGSLNISANSNITLDASSVHSLKFASAGTLTGGILTIANWQGSFNGTSGTKGKLFIGATASLTTSQLGQIQFTDGSGNIYMATQLSTGEIVPVAPVITTTAASYGPYCNNISDAISVGFSVTGTYAGTFYVQLSNVGGSFPSSTTANIISASATTSPISATIPSGSTAGNYRVRVLCSSPSTIYGSDNGSNIVINGTPTVTAGNGGAVCASGTLSLTGTPSGGSSPYTYVWAGAGTISSTTAQNPTVTSLTAGTSVYSVTLTDANSCSASATTTATVNPVPSPSVSASPTSVVSGGSSTLTFSGNNGDVVNYTDGTSTYTVTIGATGTSTITVTPGATTTYSITSATTVLGCMATITGQTATVVVSSAPTAAISGNTTICPGGNATLSFSGTAGATVYYWNGGTGSTSSVALSGTVGTCTASVTVSPTVTAVYTLTSVYSGGTSYPVTGSATVTVTNPVITSIGADAGVCPGGTLHLNAAISGGTAPYTYSWNGSSGYTNTASSSATTNSVTVTSIPATPSTPTYTLVVTDNNGCVSTGTNTVSSTILPLPTATVTGTTTIVTGSSTALTFTGTANAVVTYAWGTSSTATTTLNSSGTASVSVSPTSTTVYTLTTATSTAGCAASISGQTATIIVDATPVYYSKSTGNLNSLSTWGLNTDGSGSAPTSFTAASQTFHVANGNTTIGGNWTVSGSGSTINVDDATDLTVPSTYTVTGTINVGASRTLKLKNATLPTLGTLNATSTVIYSNLTAVVLPTVAVTYGNIVFDSTTSVTTPTVAVAWSFAGNFTVQNSSSFAGAGSKGVSLTATGTANQTISANGNTLTIYNFLDSKTSGTLTLASSTNLNVNNSMTFALSGGTSDQFSDGGNTITVGNNFYLSGTASSYNFTGKTIFAGASGTQNIGATGTSDACVAALNNMTIATTGTGKVGINPTTGGGTLTVNGNFAVSTAAGIISFNGNTLALGGNFTYLPSGATDEIASGTGVSTIDFNGTAVQTYSTNVTGGQTVKNITINNASGLTLNSSLNVGTLLTLTNGVITTGSNALNIASTGSVTGASTSSYVNGTLNKAMPASTTSITYEVGDVTYSPIQLAFSSAVSSGSIAVKSTNGLHPSISSSYINSSNMVNRYWTLTNSGVSVSSVTASFSYSSSDITSGGSNAGYIVRSYSGSAWTTAPTTTNSTTATAPLLSDASSASGLSTASLSADYVAGSANCSASAGAVSVSPSSACGTGTVTAALTGVTSGTGVTYQWLSSATGAPASYAPITGATAASYTATGVSSTTYYECQIGCVPTGVMDSSSAASVTINPVPSPSVSATPSTVLTGSASVLTFAGNSGDIINYTDGVSTYSVAVGASGTGTVSVTPLVTTTYSVTSASSALGCSATISGQSATVTVSPLPSASISGSTSICTGSSTELSFSGTAGATVYYWDGGLGATESVTLSGSTGTGTASVTVSPTVTAVYTLTSVYSGGVSYPVSGSATVTVNSLPTPTISGTTSIIAGNSATINFSGNNGDIVSYTDGATTYTVTIAASGTTTVSVTPTITTTYSVTSATSLSGCTAVVSGQTATVTVTNPTASISGSTSICSGTSTTLSFSGTNGATIYYWDGGIGATESVTLSGSGSASVTVSPTSTATYTLTSVNYLGSSYPVTGAVTVTVNALPTASVSGTASITSGSSTPLVFSGTANAVVTYAWAGPSSATATLNSSGSATVSVSPTVTTTYSVTTVVSTAGCTQTMSGATVTVTLSGSSLPYVWTGTAGDHTWGTSGNWTSSVVPTSSSWAQYSVAGTNSASAIAGTSSVTAAFTTSTVSAGAIDVAATRTLSTTFNSNISGGTTLTLNGATVYSVSNTVLANEYASATSYTATPMNLVTGSNTLNLVFNNSSPVILGAIGTSSTVPSSTINITGNITSSGGAISFLGRGTWNGTSGTNGGLLRLGGANTFTNAITVGNSDGTSNGILELDAATAINNSSTNTITINNNSQLYLASPITTGVTYSTSATTLYLNGQGNNASLTGTVALFNLNTGYTWPGAIVLSSNAGIGCNGSGSTLTLSGTVSGTGELMKTQGKGTLVFSGSGNSWSGGTMITNGAIQVNSGSQLGSGALQLAAASGKQTAVNLFNATQTVNGLSSVETGTLTPANTLTLNGTALTVNQNSADGIFGTGGTSNLLTSIITGSGSVIKTGSYNLVFTSAGHTFTGGITVTNGGLFFTPITTYTVSLGSCPVTLNGGTFGTYGAGGTYTVSANTQLNFSTLNVQASSILALDPAHTNTVNFAASNGVSWASGDTLTITGWQGSYSGGTVGTTGRVFVGSSASGLTSAQLGKVQFYNGTSRYPATILSTGELVPSAQMTVSSVSPSGPLCNGSSNTLTVVASVTGSVTGTYSVQASNSTGVFSDYTSNIIGTSATNTITATVPAGFAPGSYQLRVINGSPLSASSAYGSSIVVNASPTITATGNGGAVCGGSSLLLNTSISGGAPSYTYAWSGPSGYTSSATSSATTNSVTVTSIPSAPSNPVYSVTVTDANSCSISSTTTATVNPTPSPTITSSPSTIVSGSSSLLTFTGNNGDVVYYWNGSTTVSTTIGAAGTSTVSVSPASTTTYSVTSATSALGCSATISGVTTTVTVSSAPTASISGSTTICEDTSTVLSFTGTAAATVYYWNGGTGTTSSIVLSGSTGTGTASVTVSPTVTAVYTLTSVYSGGTSYPVTGSATVTVIPTPVATLTATSAVCSGNAATISVSSGTPLATINVNSGLTMFALNSSGIGSATVIPTSTTTYTAIVTASGCAQSATGSPTVTVNPLPVASVTGTASIAYGSSTALTFNGTANAVVTYAWGTSSTATATLNSSGTGSVSVTPSVTTTYSLTAVTSAVGCMQSITGQTATITVTGGIASVSVTATSPNADTVGLGATNVVLQHYNLAVSSSSATLSGLTVTTAGSYVSADILDLKCWYSASSTFDATATLLSTYTAPGAAGSKTFPSFTSQTLPVGTGYIYVTADVSASATSTHTINIASTTTSSFNLGSATVSGSTIVAANSCTILGYSEPQPFDLSTGSWTLTGWRTAASAGYYPGNGADGSGAGEVTPATSANMVFHTMSGSGDPTLANVAVADYASSYNGISGTRMRGEGTSGFGWLNTGSGTLGEAVLGLKTSGRDHIQVSWTAGEFGSAPRVYYVRAQYRIGTTGGYTDLPDTVFTQITDTSTVVGTKSYGPITLPASCENKPVVEVRWVYYFQGTGSGARPEKVITNISVTSNAIGATPVVSISGVSPVRANVPPGTSNVVLQTYSVNVTGAVDTFSGLNIVTGGNYATSDLSDIKLWYSSVSSFSTGSATLLSTIISPSTAGTLSFPSFYKTMDVIGGAKYYFVTADISSTPALGDSININGTPLANFNLGTTASVTGTDPVAASSYQTINVPNVALSSASPATGSIGAGTTNNVIDAYSLNVTVAPATLSGLTIATGGTYTSSDVSDFKCWYSPSSTFSSSTSTLLSTKSTGLGAGTQIFPAFTSTVIPVGVGYIYITADLTSGSTIGHTVSIATDSFSSFSLGVATITGTNPVPASNVQTIAGATVAVSNTSPAAESIGTGRTNVLLQTYNLEVTSSVAAALSGLTVSTGGSYTATDLSNLECWYSTSSTFSAATATLVSTLSAPSAAGSQVFPSFITQTIPAGTTGYVYITANIASTATAGHTLNVASTSFSGFSFGTATLTGTNPVPAANTITISQYTDPIPFALSSGNYLFNNWPSTSATGTYPANMIFHYMSTNPATLTSVAAGDYVAAYNYTTNSRVSGQGSNGYSMFNNGTGNGGMPAGEYGESVLAINSLGRSDIQVSWTAGTISANTSTWAVRAQYRIGTTGSYTDLPYTTVGQIEDTSSTGGASKNFGPITLPGSCEGQSDVEIRWIYYSQSGTSAPEMNVTNVQVTSSVAVTPTVSIAATAPAAASHAQGTPNVLLQTYDLGVSGGTATLSELGVSLAGTYSAADITDLKCWYSSSATFNSATATLLSTNSAITASGVQTFPSFTPQAIAVGSGYIYVTADLSATATIGDVLNVDTTSFGDFNLGSATLTGTNPVAASNSQTIVAPASIALTSTPPAAGKIYASNSVVLQQYDLTVSSIAATLSNMSVSANGTFAATDITDLKCWYSSSATFSTTTATLLGTTSGSVVIGNNIFPTFLAQTLPIGVNYIYITADVASLPTTGNTIYIDTTNFGDFSVGAATITGTSPIAAANVQTISVHDPTPYTLSSGTYTMSNWPSTSAAGTYPANMIFHYMNAVDPSISSVPSADYTLAYSSTSTAGIQGQGSSGFVFYNKGGANIGEAVLALNTTGEVNVKVGWTGGTYVASSGSRTYAIKAQYRIGTTGTYTDLTTDSTLDQYLSSGAAVGTQSFAPVTLPASCENQSDVEIRWIYYFDGASSGNRPQLNVTNIQVSGNSPSATITGSSTICSSHSAIITVTGGTPDATVTLTPGGASFTLSDTGSGSVAVTPSVTTSYTASVSKSGITAAGTGTVTITLAQQQWAGATSTDWNTASNWVCGSVPLATDTVVIPAATIYAPLISSGVVSIPEITITGNKLNIASGAQLNVSAKLTNNGTIAGNGIVYLDGLTTQVVSGNGKISNLTINNNSGVTVDTAAGDSLGISGTLLLNTGNLSTNNKLMLTSDSAGTGVIGAITGGSITGNVTVQQYIQGGRRAYRFWAHPFGTEVPLNQMQQYIDITGEGGTTNGFTETITNAPSAYWYNPMYGNSSMGSDPGWRSFTSVYGTPDSNNLHQYEGMRLFIRGAKGEGLDGLSYEPSPVTVRMWGAVNTGNQTETMIKGTGANQDYNLLGNPYPAVTDIGSVINNAYTGGLLAGDAFYVWDPYYGTSGQFVSIPIGGAYYIGPNESFEVRTAANGDALSFTESNKGSTASAVLMRKNEQGAELMIYDDSYHPWDKLDINFSDAATDNDDNRYDGDKPPSPATLNFYSWSADGNKLSLDARPYQLGKLIPLGLTSSYAQEFIIKAGQVNLPQQGSLYLHDKYLGTYTAMQEGAEYKFSITADPASQGDKRFELKLGNADQTSVAAKMNVSLSPNPATDEVTINYIFAGSDKVSLNIYNAAGECVIAKDLGANSSGSATISLSALPAGVYVSELTSGTQKSISRFVKE